MRFGLIFSTSSLFCNICHRLYCTLVGDAFLVTMCTMLVLLDPWSSGNPCNFEKFRSRKVLPNVFLLRHFSPMKGETVTLALPAQLPLRSSRIYFLALAIPAEKHWHGHSCVWKKVELTVLSNFCKQCLKLCHFVICWQSVLRGFIWSICCGETWISAEAIIWPAEISRCTIWEK